MSMFKYFHRHVVLVSIFYLNYHKLNNINVFFKIDVHLIIIYLKTLVKFGQTCENQ